MEEKRLCERCLDNGEQVEATVQCEKCEQWLCDACWGKETVCTDRGCMCTRNGDGWPPVYEKLMCDSCMQDETERHAAAREDYSDDDMFESRRKAFGR